MASKYKKRSDGRYLIQVQTGIQENGKPKYKNIYAKTIKELEEKAATFRQELEKGIVVDDQNLTVEKWALKWLEIYKPDKEYTNKEYYTRKMYESVIRVHIIPALGRYKLSELKPYHIMEMINTKLAEGYTRTVEKIYLTINQILKQAVTNELIYKNVAADIKLPKIEKNEKRSLSDKEKGYIQKADFTAKQRAFVYTLLYTGLRKGEILALTHNDINMKERTITVSKSIVIKSNQSEIKDSPKSDAGNRVIPIIDELYFVLQEYLSEKNSIYVFPSATGKLMSHKAFSCLWESIMGKLNLVAGGKNGKNPIYAIAQDITPHMFRHTYATMLYYAGVGVKSAQYLLGHASIRMTMELYTHLDKTKDNEIITDKLNAYLGADKIESSFSQKSVKAKNQSK